MHSSSQNSTFDPDKATARGFETTRVCLSNNQAQATPLSQHIFFISQILFLPRTMGDHFVEVREPGNEAAGC